MAEYIALLRNSGLGAYEIVADLVALRDFGERALADPADGTAAAFQLKAGEQLVIVSRMYAIAKFVRAELLGL